jgi:hypothetical protein
MTTTLHEKSGPTAPVAPMNLGLTVGFARQIPEQLASLAGPCGPISVWLVLARHGIAAEPDDIIKRCRYTDNVGSFAVCLAETLQHFGLPVRFHSDPDPAPHALELEAYRRVSVAPAVSLSSLIERVRSGASVIVSYLAPGGDGHFSPLEGTRANKLLLAYSVSGQMLRSEFGKRWRADGILRQAIVSI